MSIVGIIGKVIGGTQHFYEDGTAHAVTAIEAGPCTITQIKSLKKDGYQSVQLGFERLKKASKPKRGHLAVAGDDLFRHLRETKSEDYESLELGSQIDVGMFEVGEKVNVTGISKGKGFQGGVKRYNFRGGPKTHGQSDRHRAPGSIGAGTTPGRVIKGMRMAGRMGGDKVTVKNLDVVMVDTERNLLLVKGAVPGHRNSVLLISKSNTKS
jgi:large subunit ribosomal protein L3